MNNAKIYNKKWFLNNLCLNDCILRSFKRELLSTNETKYNLLPQDLFTFSNYVLI